MSHLTQAHVGQASFSSFSITQPTLGSPLEFEPALGSQELENLIDNYVPGLATTQQKRARVVLEFLNSIDAYSYQHPVCLHYYVPLRISTQLLARRSSATLPAHKSIEPQSASASKPSNSLKRARQEPAVENPSNAKRLPGFSILTRDGIDITEYASRGPKTKEQRDHAALMRKLKACAACKRSKQKCDPSHHHPVQSTLGTPSSATSTARHTSFSSGSGSQGSISPLSSLGESFSQSPTQNFATRAIAHTGQRFPPLPIHNPNLSPSDFTLPDLSSASAILSASPTDNDDSELFWLADGEFDALQANLSHASSNVNSYSSCINQDDLLALSYGTEPATVSDVNNLWQCLSGGSSSHDTYGDILGQDSDPQSTLCQTIVSSDSLDSELAMNQWLHPSRTALGDNARIRQSALQVAGNSQVGGSSVESRSEDSELLAIRHDQDYILYPDSEQFNLGLEAEQIDVASTRWPAVPKYSAGRSELQSNGLQLSHRHNSMYPVLENGATAEAYNTELSPVLFGRSQLDQGVQSYGSDRSLNLQCDYRTVTRDGPLLDGNDGFSSGLVPYVQDTMLDASDQIPRNYRSRVNDRIPSDSRHILQVNDPIPDVNRDQEKRGHAPPLSPDLSSTSIQDSHKNTSRSSQEDDAPFVQISGASDHYHGTTVFIRTELNSLVSLGHYLENVQPSRVSPIIEDGYPTSQYNTSSPSLCYTTPEEVSTLEQSSSVVEGESKYEPRMGMRQAGLQQLVLSLQTSRGLVEHIENGRNRKMDLFVSLCILMTISILATISLLVAGSDYAIDSIPGPFLQDTVRLYNDLPEFQPSVTYGPLEFILAELDPWNKYEMAPQTRIETAPCPYYRLVPYSDYSNSQSDDLVKDWPVIPETRLTSYGTVLEYGNNPGSSKDSQNGCQSTSWTYGTPTTTTVNPTTMPMMTSTPVSRAVDTLRTDSKPSNSRPSFSSLLWKASPQMRSLNKRNILGDITLRMTSLRIG